MTPQAFHDASEEHAATIARLAGELAAEAGPPFGVELAPGLSGRMMLRATCGHEPTSQGDDRHMGVWVIATMSVPDLVRRFWSYVERERERFAREKPEPKKTKKRSTNEHPHLFHEPV